MYTASFHENTSTRSGHTARLYTFNGVVPWRNSSSMKAGTFPTKESDACTNSHPSRQTFSLPFVHNVSGVRLAR